jgi:Predicted ATPase (AAA+ superfamily)
MLKDVVLVQKRELENQLQETYVERKVSDHLDLGNDLIKVITGPRRAGKSFCAAHLIAQTGSYGYINFDDERLVAVEEYDEIIGAIKAVYGNPRYLFFDEIQNLPRWEMFANRLQRQRFRLLITGSNANLLSSELATHLTGRHAAVALFPFSFREYLTISENQKTAVEKKDALDVYVEQGGYPEPLLKK